MAKQGPELVDQRLAKALEHPIRTDILSILREGPSSPARIQRRLERVSLNLVSHHMKVLKELGCVELTKTVSKQGAKEHIYRLVGPVIVSDEEWNQFTPEMRHPVTASILRALSRDLREALVMGRLDETPANHLSRTPLRLDEEGWKEVSDTLARALDEILAAGARSVERLKDGEETHTPVTVAILQFPTGDPEGPP